MPARRKCPAAPELASSRVVVVTTGGTIGAVSDPANGKEIGADGEEAVRSVVAATGAQVAPLWRTSSVELGLGHALELADYLEEAVNDCGAEGVVVTVGTDTLEEISFALELVWAGEVPCVFTASMYTPEVPGSDAEQNISDAVRIARKRHHRELGVTAVLGGVVHSARYVYKSEPSGPQAFRSYGPGPIGLTDDAALWASPQYRSRCLRLPKPLQRKLPFVPMLTMVGGDDGRMLGAVAGLDPAGIVVCGTGAGNVSAAALSALSRIRERDIPVVVASRTGKPALLPESDGSPSRYALREIGCIFAACLNGLKARLLLMMLLANGLGGDARTWFESPA